MIGAGVAAVLLAATWLLWDKNTSLKVSMALPERFRNEVLPGGDEAKLTLDDGAVIIMVDTVNGLLATDASGRTSVYKENGWLSYHATDLGDSLYFNTIRVPPERTI